jgi:hypothetical protein
MRNREVEKEDQLRYSKEVINRKGEYQHKQRGIKGGLKTTGYKKGGEEQTLGGGK